MTTQKTMLTLATLATTLVAGSAAAGPDWTAIERARAAVRTQGVTADSSDDKLAAAPTLHPYGPRPQNLRQGAPKNPAGDSAAPSR